MARLNSTSEVIHDLRSVGYYSDSATTTTLSAEEAAGQTALSVASEAGFAQNDIIRVGANGSTADIGRVTSVAASLITLYAGTPLEYTQANGNAVTKLTFVDLGHTSDDGVRIAHTGTETPMTVGTQVATYLFMGGANETAISFSLVNASFENFAQALGQDETTYVRATPDGVVIQPTAFASLTDKPWRLQGLDNGGNTVTWYIVAAKVVVPNTEYTISTGQPLIIPMTLRNVNYIRIVRN